ncbi:ComEC/Rec2 family competence protein [Specibacter cremeus]|uniref:ComEC/Rec2 family competence protein n=1 Tax=Specibacter cremeus TaxID=1629051 RepID=UPI000F7AA17E|nr:ComEC/Rec2 family competence protein [Specibacter cremeus]
MAESRWQRYTRAAVEGASEGCVDGAVDGSAGGAGMTPPRVPAAVVFLARKARERMNGGERSVAALPNATLDVRLVPAVAAAWLAAIVGPGMAWGPCLFLAAGCAMAAVGPAVWLAARSSRDARRARLAGTSRTGARTTTRTGPVRASAVVGLAGACAAAVLVAAGLAHRGADVAPMAGAIAARQGIVATLVIESRPSLLAAGPGRGNRYVLEAVVTRASAAGRVFDADTRVRMIAGDAWRAVTDGDIVVAAGALAPVGAADAVGATFQPATAPQMVGHVQGIAALPRGLRGGWIAAAQRTWTPVNTDVAALLPGMVMGDRSDVPPDLDEDMKVVGLTHLTAVSGANCTLVLMSLLLVGRFLRLHRGVGMAVGGMGLAGFVMVVGPDPSVLRAAVMGAIGCAAMLAGRPRRAGALLSGSIVVLLVWAPRLAVDYAFILSVLATFGLLVLGRRCARWLAVMLPWWLAQTVAVPLAAQLFCAPVIVLLQPRLTVYAVAANVAAAPVITLVTTAGTLGLALSTTVPVAADACSWVSGAGTWWVAWVSRALAALPGAALPWPGGLTGVVLMVVFNGAIVVLLWGAVHRREGAALAARVRAALPKRLRPIAGFPGVVVVAAAAAGLLAGAAGNG